MVHDEVLDLKEGCPAILAVAHQPSSSSSTAWIVEASTSLPR